MVIEMVILLLGQSHVSQNYSDEFAMKIDLEVKDLISSLYEQVKDLLLEKKYLTWYISRTY